MLKASVSRLNSPQRIALLAALSVAAGAIVSFWRGQDVNFDQLNYHFYIAYAYETHRLDVDVLAAQAMHSYLSPFLYLPFYFMVTHLSPPVVGMVTGGIHGLNLVPVAGIAWLVTATIPSAQRVAATLAAVAISTPSPMALSELGTTMADISISIPVLAGLMLLMRAEFTDNRISVATMARITMAGALVGAAVSLKLTGAAFAAALAASALVGWETWRQRLAAILATGTGGLIGFAVAGGVWYLRMWREFGNPVFPYYNTLFRSPDYQRTDALFDAKYLPHSLADAVVRPFQWVGIQRTTSEELFRDVRFAALILLGIAAFGVWAVRSQKRVARGTPAQRRLIIFFTVAFCVWTYEWSIQRYIVVLELLTGPAVIVLLQWSGAFGGARRWTLSGLAMLAILCAATVKAPDWSHIPWGQDWYEVNPPAVSGGHPLYFLDGEPLAYVASALPPGSTVVGVVPREPVPAWGDTVFLRRIHDLVANAGAEPIQAIARTPLSDSFKDAIAQYGLRADGECQTTPGRPQPLLWCRLVTLSPSKP